MNTQQLAVAWIATLSSSSILVAHGLTRVAPAYLVAAIALVAATLIYSLRPLPVVNKRRIWLVVGLALLICAGSVACYVEKYKREETRKKTGLPGALNF